MTGIACSYRGLYYRHSNMAATDKASAVQKNMQALGAGQPAHEQEGGLQ